MSSSIDKSYREIARFLHPDKGPSNGDMFIHLRHLYDSAKTPQSVSSNVTEKHKHELDELRKNLSQKQMECSALHQQLQSMKYQLGDYEARNEYLLQQNYQYSHQITQNQSEMYIVKAHTTHDHKQTISSLHSENSELRKQIEKLTDSKNKLKLKTSELKDNIEISNADHRYVSAKLTSLISIRDKQKVVIEDLRSRLSIDVRKRAKSSTKRKSRKPLRFRITLKEKPRLVLRESKARRY